MVHFNHFFFIKILHLQKNRLNWIHPERNENVFTREDEKTQLTKWNYWNIRSVLIIFYLALGTWNTLWFTTTIDMTSFHFPFNICRFCYYIGGLFAFFIKYIFFSNIFFRTFFFEYFFFQNVARTELIAISFESRFVHYWVSIDQIRISFNLFILYSL